MLGHKRSLSTFKKIEIIASIFSDHSGMKLEVNYKKNTGKTRKMWRIRQYATAQPKVYQRNQRGIFKNA